LLDPPPAAAELPTDQRRLFGVIKADESIHIDDLIEKFDSELSSSEIFSALFELELSNKIRQLPGKNYVRVF
jgi:DNA processing protein